MEKQTTPTPREGLMSSRQSCRWQRGKNSESNCAKTQAMENQPGQKPVFKAR
jgi:hypothetical protein